MSDNGNAKGRKVGDVSFSVAPFLEALARKNLNLPLTLPDDASEKTRASYAKAKAGREAGSKAKEIGESAATIETAVREGNEDTIAALVEIFTSALTDFVAVAPPKQKLRDRLAERESEIEVLRKKLARMQKKLDKGSDAAAE